MQRTRVPAVRWWQALDAPIYLISLLPGAAVWLLAGSGASSFAVIAPATLAVVLLQHAINVLNDVSDWRLGADDEKHHSWARYHDLNLPVAAAHGYASLLAGALLGIAVLLQAGKLWIVAFAAPLVLLGYLYNSGPRPLAYTHLGEWVTGLCYGPGVFGCLWLLATGQWSLITIAGSVAFFALAVALLLSHQPPQIATDRAAGKQSFAVRYGAHATRRTAQGLFVVFLLALGVAISQAGPASAATLAFGLCAVPAAGFVLWRHPSPRRILPAAMLVILVPLAVERALALGAVQVGLR
jgi:1,4-dihydroxy-2-naphthoate octaprenyltransferase